MYMEGSTKGFLAVLFAVLLAVSLAFWPETKFVLRFLGDLLFMNGRDGWHSLMTYLHLFWQNHNPFT